MGWPGKASVRRWPLRKELKAGRERGMESSGSQDSPDRAAASAKVLGCIVGQTWGEGGAEGRAVVGWALWVLTEALTFALGEMVCNYVI